VSTTAVPTSPAPMTPIIARSLGGFVTAPTALFNGHALLATTAEAQNADHRGGNGQREQ